MQCMSACMSNICLLAERQYLSNSLFHIKYILVKSLDSLGQQTGTLTKFLKNLCENVKFIAKI